MREVANPAAWLRGPQIGRAGTARIAPKLVFCKPIALPATARAARPTLLDRETPA
jgi:hypothetical protein